MPPIWPSPIRPGDRYGSWPTACPPMAPRSADLQTCGLAFERGMLAHEWNQPVALAPALSERDRSARHHRSARGHLNADSARPLIEKGFNSQGGGQ